jgi:hypothetical protein
MRLTLESDEVSFIRAMPGATSFAGIAPQPQITTDISKTRSDIAPASTET